MHEDHADAKNTQMGLARNLAAQIYNRSRARQHLKELSLQRDMLETSKGV